MGKFDAQAVMKWCTRAMEIYPLHDPRREEARAVYEAAASKPARDETDPYATDHLVEVPDWLAKLGGVR